MIAIKFYKELSGREPVRLWLQSLSHEERKIIGRDIKIIQMYWPVGMPRVRSLDKGLWEIRSTLPSRIARIIFAFSDNRIILLHGFIKKTNKIPLKDLEKALKRCDKKRVLHHG